MVTGLLQAPGLTPLLFSDLGIWGVLVFLDPLKDKEDQR